MNVLDHLGDVVLPEAVRAAILADEVGAIVCDDRRVVVANDRFLEIVGFSREQLEAGEVSWVRMTVPSSMADDARAIGSMRATGRADAYDKQFITRDGARVGVRLADRLIALEPLTMFALVASGESPAELALVAELDAAP